jgi:ribosomal protein S18 acetylase RimI-like enzyme
MAPEITFRSAGAEDEDFLFRLFRSAHEYKFVALNLSEQQLTQLLRMQFTGQQRQYHEQFPAADFHLVLADGLPIGRLYVYRSPDAIDLIDITIMPPHRTGIGGALVRQLLREAAACGKPVRAHVEKMNRAWKLYQRLGFRIVGDTGMYFQIEWTA